ncbi:penicillin-binding protein 2 [Comamonas piscis]|uniref:Peptidoglycan D,D-transpeptidase FtsI n=1 Tax=Comamonas piscis TaxID=1562974 RepID=A0A7G5EMR1_9BURK|nr:penicillin-binding protein 2 [Comamonas piscis]QMV75286.1 penicillin-binding protein 2 [Comamonas piscis]WSO33777.1 penicillin-binding protein 2 [Comamonas piscis]
MSKDMRYSTSPLLAERTPMWRSRFIMIGLALAFTGLIGRAAYVQVIGNDFFLRQGEVRFARTIELPANRGRILDRNGLILASSVPASSIWAIPEDVDQDDPAIKGKLAEIAKLIGMPKAQFDAKLADEDKSFVWIKRQLDWDIGQKIKALDVKGIYLRKEYKRQYPEGESAAHVVGFTNVEDQGQEGMELAFNTELGGKAGSRRVIKDRLGRIVEGVGVETPPQEGQDIQLSIDSKVQFFAYQKLRDQVAAFKAKAGSVVVMDAHTGEVLALANYPSYDPNNRSRLTGEQLRNRAITDTFEPGSTMKPITVGTALELGRVKNTTIIDTTPGRYAIGGFTISDTHNYGALTVDGVIQKSSNVGALKVAQKMSAQEMWNVHSALGYGQKPQIAFPGAASGRLRPWKTWKPVEQATISYGYGLSASLFQMARSYTVFSNDGNVIPATMLKRTGRPAGTPVFSKKTAELVRHMLWLAAGPGGTGQKAQTVGYSIGGKSGTARKQQGRGYAAGKYRAWFTGIAPIENPRIIVAVMVDEPSQGSFYGGTVAGPVFSEVVQQTLRLMGVQPDMSVKPQIVANDVEEPL